MNKTITENWLNPLGLVEYVPMLKKRLYLKGKCSGTSLSRSPPYPSSKKNWINSSDALRKRQFHQVKDPSSRPKIANDTHLFSQPTSSTAWGYRLIIWDPRGPIRPPKPPYITFLIFLMVNKDPSSLPKIAKITIFFSTHFICAMGV